MDEVSVKADNFYKAIGIIYGMSYCVTDGHRLALLKALDLLGEDDLNKTAPINLSKSSTESSKSVLLG